MAPASSRERATFDDDFDIDKARSVIEQRLSAGGGWLDAVEVDSLMRAVKIPTAPLETARTAEEALEASLRIGFPVVLKAQGPRLLHKTESGAVILNLEDECAVRDAYIDLQTRLGEEMTGAIVQSMVRGGIEVMIGATEQPTFGHVLAYGAGGTLVELLADASFRIHPITDIDADDMLGEVRSTRLLRGFRGAAPSDISAVKEILMRVSALLSVCPEIREVDINPLKVLEHGAIAVDARIRVEKNTPLPASRRVTY